ncbi:MAG: phosphoribosylformylglycinamidine synthase subunit PurS [Bacteroidetes bacterium]|nr:phosphoribosylformylglycinamidine synthase subunit PurS [Bacteroidota bacterium]
MVYTVYINILPHPGILDPQGKATLSGLHNLGFAGVQEVRIGKRIRLNISAASVEEARQLAEESARKLLANPITEVFSIELEVQPA